VYNDDLIERKYGWQPGGHMKRLIYLLAAIAAGFVGLTFAIQNRQVVDLIYYFGLEWRGPISLALLVAMTFGIAVGYLASLRTVVRMQRLLARARKEVRQVEQEVRNLRALPIKDVL